MRKILVAGACAGVVVLGAALALWPKSQAGAQVNVDGCTCSRPTALSGAGRADLQVWHCVCPGMQCVITAAPAANAAPNLEQSCK